MDMFVFFFKRPPQSFDVCCRCSKATSGQTASSSCATSAMAEYVVASPQSSPAWVAQSRRSSRRRSPSGLRETCSHLFARDSDAPVRAPSAFSYAVSFPFPFCGWRPFCLATWGRRPRASYLRGVFLLPRSRCLTGSRPRDRLVPVGRLAGGADNRVIRRSSRSPDVLTSRTLKRLYCDLWHFASTSILYISLDYTPKVLTSFEPEVKS